MRLSIIVHDDAARINPDLRVRDKKFLRDSDSRTNHRSQENYIPQRIRWFNTITSCLLTEICTCTN